MQIFKKIFFVILLILATLFVMSIISNSANVEVTTDDLNLREGPTTDSTVYTTIPNGTKVEMIGEEEGWYQIKYQEYTGYISKDYAKIVQEESNQGDDNQTTQTKTYKISKNTDIRILPLLSSSKLSTIKQNKEIMVISNLNGWVYIQTEEISGWIREDNISETTTTTPEPSNQEPSSNENTNNTELEPSTNNNYEEKTGYINDAFVNVRKGPSTDTEIIKVLVLNNQVTIIGEEGDWYHVNSDEDIGYISKELVSDTRIQETSRSAEPRTSSTTTTNTSKGNAIVEYAKQFLGVPYVYGGASESGFDCSGFTMYVYEQFGISLPHGATSQSYYGTEIDASKSELEEKLQIGDLVFFLDYPSYDGIGHVGIYIGNGEFIHASSGSGYCVKISTLLEGGYYDRYTTARRLF